MQSLQQSPHTGLQSAVTAMRAKRAAALLAAHAPDVPVLALRCLPTVSGDLRVVDTLRGRDAVARLNHVLLILLEIY